MKTGYAEGTCPVCGKKIRRRRPADVAVCDCWEHCPIDGKKMQPYTPDLTLSRYDSEKGLDVIMWHNSPGDHKEPYYSKQRPVEVRLT
jgi:hypothetical protein